MFVIFIKFAQYDDPTDLAFSRVEASRLRGTLSNPLAAGRGMGRKRYQQQEVSSLIKEAAVVFQLDPNKFSTKSFKNGGITTIKLNERALGVSSQDIANQFDHKSIASSRRYQKETPVESGERGPLKFLQENKVYAHKNLTVMR
jgi:hypothetical protein